MYHTKNRIYFLSFLPPDLWKKHILRLFHISCFPPTFWADLPAFLPFFTALSTKHFVLLFHTAFPVSSFHFPDIFLLSSSLSIHRFHYFPTISIVIAILYLFYRFGYAILRYCGLVHYLLPPDGF